MVALIETLDIKVCVTAGAKENGTEDIMERQSTLVIPPHLGKVTEEKVPHQ